MKKNLVLSVFVACLAFATKNAHSAPCAALGGIDTSCPVASPAPPPATSPTPKPQVREEYTYDPGNKNGGNSSKLPQVQSNITKNFKPEIVDLTGDEETVHGPEMKFTFTQVAPAR